MLSNIFLGLSLVGAEWVLYLLLILSVVSVGIMIERARFYRLAIKGLNEYRQLVRKTAENRKWSEIEKTSIERIQSGASDLDACIAAALTGHKGANSVEVLSEVANDALVCSRLKWEKNLAILATIGSNAPFVGLFGTVLGIIKAFHDLSQQAGAGVQMVTAGISEALVATAVGILVAVPAVVAFNLFQRKVRTAATEAEATKSYLIGKLANGG